MEVHNILLYGVWLARGHEALLSHLEALLQSRTSTLHSYSLYLAGLALTLTNAAARDRARDLLTRLQRRVTPDANVVRTLLSAFSARGDVAALTWLLADPASRAHVATAWHAREIVDCIRRADSEQTQHPPKPLTLARISGELQWQPPPAIAEWLNRHLSSESLASQPLPPRLDSQSLLNVLSPDAFSAQPARPVKGDTVAADTIRVATLKARSIPRQRQRTPQPATQYWKRG